MFDALLNQSYIFHSLVEVRNRPRFTGHPLALYSYTDNVLDADSVYLAITIVRMRNYSMFSF